MSKTYKLLVINPGSTSTKVSCYSDLNCTSSKTLQHGSSELDKNNSIMDQYLLRKQAVLDYLSEQDINANELDAVVGRGGLLKPLTGGTYSINNTMLEELKSLKYGQHASNLGAVIAYEIAYSVGIPSFIVNPVVVDELEPLARYSGLPEIPRIVVFHALNQKAVARKAARDLNKRYEDINLIVAHLGGGISIGAHHKGQVIDVNNGLEEGPFSPERSGNLPVIQLVEMCFSGRYTKDEIKKKLVGKSGLAAYLGTSDGKEIEQRVDTGDKDAQAALEAMAYQIAREIAACGAVLSGNIDSIIITGGFARCGILVKWISERVKWMAPILIYPGEDEMSALAEGALSVLKGEIPALTYK